MDEIWRTVSEAPEYDVSSHGRVRNGNTGRQLNVSTGSVVLSSYSGNFRRSVRRLMHDAFGAAEVGEEWRDCRDAYSYAVSNLGRVMNKKTGRILRPNPNGQVTMMDAGWKICRTVSKLVQEAFD